MAGHIVSWERINREMEAGAQLMFSFWFQSKTPEYGMVSHKFSLTFLSSVKLILEMT